MNPYRKAVAFVIRLIALAFILLPLIFFGLDYMATKTNHAPPPKWALLVKIGSVVFGFVLLIVSGKIARRLTEDLEE